MIYREYITSDEWKKRKERYFENHVRRCRACGSAKRIHLHHKTYRRLGQERDADLVPLCHLCHSALHRIQKQSGQNLWIATEVFIRGKERSRSRKKKKKNQVVKRKSRLHKKETRS